MPINPVPPPTPADKLQQAVKVASDYGWHVAAFLTGTIVGYIIGVW